MLVNSVPGKWKNHILTIMENKWVEFEEQIMSRFDH